MIRGDKPPRPAPGLKHQSVQGPATELPDGRLAGLIATAVMPALFWVLVLRTITDAAGVGMSLAASAGVGVGIFAFLSFVYAALAL